MNWLAGIAAAIALHFPADKPFPHPETVRVEVPRVEVPRAEVPRAEVPRKRFDTMQDCPVSGRTDYDQFYVASAYKHGTPSIGGIHGACWEKARAQAESGQQPTIVSPANAVGVMQLLPGTFADMGGQDIRDPQQNIDAGTKYSAWCYSQWRAHNRTPEQRKPLADACYNWGLGHVLSVQKQWACTNWPCFDPHMPHETQVYTRRIDLLARTGEWLK